MAGNGARRAARLLDRCRAALESRYWRLRPTVRGRPRPARFPDRFAFVPFGPDARRLAPETPAACVVCHLFHADMAEEFRVALGHIPFPVDVYLSTDTADKRAVLEAAFADFPSGRVVVALSPNRGRDVSAKLVTFRDVYSRHEYVLLVHGKRSGTSRIGEGWREALLEALVGSPGTVSSIVALFERDPSLGIVMARNFPPLRRHLNWDHNFPIARELARRMGIELTRRHVLDFPAGSMFWARTRALRPLLDLELAYEDFPPERGQVRTTVQHAVERLVLFACERAGYRWLKVDSRHDALDARDAADGVVIDDEAQLAAFLALDSLRLLEPP